MRLETGSYVQACFGQTEAGDLVFSQRNELGLLFGLIDVSGHGPEAARVAREIKQWLDQTAFKTPCDLIERLDERLRGRASGVGLACQVDGAAGRYRYCGVGNPLLWQVTRARVRSLPSKPGLIGQYLPRLEERSLTLEAGDLLVLASDGVPSDAIRPEAMPAHKLRAMSTQDGALAIVRQQARSHDDASCLIVRYARD